MWRWYHFSFSATRRPHTWRKITRAQERQADAEAVICSPGVGSDFLAVRKVKLTATAAKGVVSFLPTPFPLTLSAEKCSVTTSYVPHGQFVCRIPQVTTVQPHQNYKETTKYKNAQNKDPIYMIILNKLGTFLPPQMMFMINELLLGSSIRDKNQTAAQIL